MTAYEELLKRAYELYKADWCAVRGYDCWMALEKVWNSVKSKPMTEIFVCLSGTAAMITLWKTRWISASECLKIIASKNSRLEECKNDSL